MCIMCCIFVWFSAAVPYGLGSLDTLGKTGQAGISTGLACWFGGFLESLVILLSLTSTNQDFPCPALVAASIPIPDRNTGS